MSNSQRARILNAAGDLFVHRGYHATTLQELLGAAGVGREAFYREFDSLEAVLITWLQARDLDEFEGIRREVLDRETPLTRFMAIIEAVRTWLVDQNFRGCVFVNVVGMFPDPEATPRQVGTGHYDRLRGLIEQVTLELLDSDRERYGHLDAEHIAEEYLVILTGVVCLGGIYHSDQPLQAAVRNVRRLLH